MPQPSDFKFNPEVTYFAETNFRNQEARFGIKLNDRRQHMYVIGKSGVGKSTMLENMMMQDIYNGYGLAIVDPHGETVEKMINYIPNERINDVIYFNPADINYPIAFNILEHVEPEYRHLVASGMVGAFKKIWADSWGPRLEYLLRNAILALLDYPGSTLLGVMKMLVDKEFRKKVVLKIQDPVVKSFWLDEYSRYSEKFMQEAIAPIQNKVGQFLSSSLIRNIVAQGKSKFDMREIMDNRKILLVNLSKGRVGEDNSALLGAMLITKLQLAAMSRVNMPESERKDFFLYVDEFQSFATDSFATILSEARKYHLGLIIAHQYIEQLGDVVKAAVFGNVGTLVVFRVGAEDAEFLEKEFAPRFSKIDLVNLPKASIYVKLMIDGITSDAFSAATLPPIPAIRDSEVAQKIIKVSRERYSTPREVVEEKIVKFSGQTEDDDENVIVVKAGEPEPVIRMPMGSPAMVPSSVPIVSSNDNGQTAKLAPKIVYEGNCERCGMATRVPFKPDGIRPIYCKNCLPVVRSEQAKNIGLADKLGSLINQPISQPAPISSPAPISLEEALKKGAQKF
ncbi:MAG: type IV secretion system DNA-binding domain-containing protein [bacterium]